MWKLRNKQTSIDGGDNKLLKIVLENRGVDSNSIDRIFNNPLGVLIPAEKIVNGMKAAEVIVQAIEADAEIWTFNDYDCDGMTSGFIMTDFLRRISDNTVYPYYPNRTEGYGLSMSFCRRIVKRMQEVNKPVLVITNDNGVTKVEEVAYLKANGVEVVVTDHHEPKEVLPDCVVVNPHIEADTTFHHLCGAGVSYKVIQCIEKYADLNEYSQDYLYAVALGTVADMMPPHEENQVMIRLGIMQMNSRKYCPSNIAQFKKHLGMESVTPVSIAWEFGPRLNATGRMGEVDVGAGFFYEQDVDTVLEYVEQIEKLNNERKSRTNEAKKIIGNMDFPPENAAILFDATGFPKGITGIVASKVLDKTMKPALAYSVSGNGTLTGSARVPEGIDLIPALETAVEQGVIESYGGHAQAAGFNLKPENIEAFQAVLNKELKESVDNLEIDDTVLVDSEIHIADLNKNNFYALNTLYYDREKFMRPLFVLKGVTVKAHKVSKKNKDNIEFEIDDGQRTLKIWAWGQGIRYSQLGEPKMIDIVGSIDINFLNKRYATLNVSNIFVAEKSTATIAS